MLSEFDIIFTEIIFKRKYICAESKHLRYIPLKSKKKKCLEGKLYTNENTREKAKESQIVNDFFFFIIYA